MKFAIDNRLGFCYNQYRVKCSADIAQLAEHVIGNDEVISSNLITSSREARCENSEPLFIFALLQPATVPDRQRRYEKVVPINRLAPRGE